jgi:hypothetical protein
MVAGNSRFLSKNNVVGKCRRDYMNKLVTEWVNVETLPSRSFKCGHCGNSVAANEGYWAGERYEVKSYLYICHVCNRPTFVDYNGNQVPGASYGEHVNDVPALENSLFDEASNCMSTSSYTAAVLCCRKLLMNIAVSKGAAEGLKFVQYVEYLSNQGFIPPGAKEWVDHIRTKGNEATHEIAIMKKVDAEELFEFIQILLKMIYEFPATIKRKSQAGK